MSIIMIPLQNERLEQLERAIRKKLSSFSDLRSSDLDLWQSIAIYFGFEYLINKEPYPQTPDQTERQYILFFLSVIQPIVERIQNEPNEAILQGEGLNDNAVLLNEMEPIMQIQARDPEEEEQIYNTLMLRYNQVIQFLVGFSKSEFENEFSFSKGHRCVNILIVIIGLILFFTYAFSLSGIEINPEITDPYDIQRYIIDSDVADSFIKNYETVIPGLGDMIDY